MTVNELRPGDVIRVLPNQYQVVKVDPFSRSLIVRDLMGREIGMGADFFENHMEKVDDA